LVASLLDPRFKFGPGFSVEDKNSVEHTQQMMTQTAVLECHNQDDETLIGPDLNQQQKWE